MTPTHIPPAIRGAFHVAIGDRWPAVPEWLVAVPVFPGGRQPRFFYCGPLHIWLHNPGEGDPLPKNEAHIKFARAATPTEITATRDGGRGDGQEQ